MRLGLLLTAAIAVSLAAGCGQPVGPEPVSTRPVVTVSMPVEKEVVDNRYFEGNTAAVSTVDIRARVTGYLSNVYFEDGQVVQAGQPLFLIDKRPYEATLEQAKAEVSQSEARLQRLNADFARAEKLLPMRTISQEEFDRTAGERAQAVAETMARKAAVKSADLDLHFCAISAPISGRMSRRLVTKGNLVISNETSLTTLVSIAPIYAYFDVDEPTMLQLQQMTRDGDLERKEDVRPLVYLGLDVDEGYPYKGELDFVENRVDASTGTLKVRAVFPNKDDALSPGLHARIKVPIGKPHKALMVAERAIGSSQGQKFVYVVNDKNEVVERPVKLGLLEGHLRVITAGLKPGERVIVNGLQRVHSGVTVEPKPAETPADATASTASAGAAGR